MALKARFPSAAPPEDAGVLAEAGSHGEPTGADDCPEAALGTQRCGPRPGGLPWAALPLGSDTTFLSAEFVLKLQDPQFFSSLLLLIYETERSARCLKRILPRASGLPEPPSAARLASRGRHRAEEISGMPVHELYKIVPKFIITVFKEKCILNEYIFFSVRNSPNPSNRK